MELMDFIKNFGEQLEDIDLTLLESGTAYKSLPEWDSMNVLAVIAMIDKKYNKQITAEDIEKSNTLEELFLLVRNM